MSMANLEAKISIDISELSKGLENAKKKLADFSGSTKERNDLISQELKNTTQIMKDSLKEQYNQQKAFFDKQENLIWLLIL
jgi:hypothetical protein